jgi:PEP-CTERM motif
MASYDWHTSMRRIFVFSLLTAGLTALGTPVHAQFIINPTFTANFNTNFGANAAAAQASWISAANVFTSNFTDNITVNITVDAVAGTSVFGQSNTSLFGFSYGALRTVVVADAKTGNDAIAIGAGGSMTVADPSGGSEWWVTRAQGKALGLIASDLANDGTTTFGAGNPFTFSGSITAGTYDFKGVAAHEISEVLGRLGLKGATIGSFPNSHSLADNFSYTGAATKIIDGGTNANFSIDNGTTLLKLYNDYTVNGLDSRDWAGGTNDSFNQFSNSGVVNPVSAVDLQEMDVIGYDLVAVPEPATVALFGVAFAAAGYQGWRYRQKRQQDMEKLLSCSE